MRFGAIGLVVALATLAIAACGGGDHKSALQRAEESLTPQQIRQVNRQADRKTRRFLRRERAQIAAGGGGSNSSEPAACVGLRDRVHNYNTLDPGSSRRAYLILLHTLQATCPSQAQKASLTATFLKKCRELFQENCTAYKDPLVGKPQIP